MRPYHKAPNPRQESWAWLDGGRGWGRLGSGGFGRGRFLRLNHRGSRRGGSELRRVYLRGSEEGRILRTGDVKSGVHEGRARGLVTQSDLRGR